MLGLCISHPLEKQVVKFRKEVLWLLFHDSAENIKKGPYCKDKAFVKFRCEY